MAEINKLPHKIVLNVDKVAKEVGSARVANIVLLGATIPFLGIDYEKVQDSIREIFLRKGEAIVEMNLKALAAGKEIAEKLMQSNYHNHEYTILGRRNRNHESREVAGTATSATQKTINIAANSPYYKEVFSKTRHHRR